MTTTTRQYEVYFGSSPLPRGVYPAATAEDAIEACARDAGYRSRAEAEETGHGEFAALEVDPAETTGQAGNIIDLHRGGYTAQAKREAEARSIWTYERGGATLYGFGDGTALYHGRDEVRAATEAEIAEARA